MIHVGYSTQTMILKTPVGPLTLGYIKDNLICEFGHKKINREPSKKLASQLRDYLQGKKVKRFEFKTPKIATFTTNCWDACRNIPYGETKTYKELAQDAGSPNAMRAAGQAMRNNPLTILTPCHRVIASNGKLHGYGGATNPKSKQLKQKAFLLNLEQSTMS